MEVTITRTAKTLTAMVDGDIDAGNGHHFASTVARSISHDVESVVIDMSGLEFMDSSGISRLVELRQLALAAGATFRVVRLAPNVRRVLEISGLMETFGIDD